MKSYKILVAAILALLLIIAGLLWWLQPTWLPFDMPGRGPDSAPAMTAAETPAGEAVTDTKPTTETPADDKPAAKKRLDPAAFEVLNVSERTLDNKPALAIIFSGKLNSTKRYDKYISVSDKNNKQVDGAWVLSENQRILYFPHIQPETRYTVQVQRGLPAADGKALDAIAEHSVTTRKITPAFGFASRGSVLPAKLSEGLPIMSVNIPEIDIEFLRVKDDKLADFMYQYYYKTRHYYYELSRMHAFAESVYLARFTTEAEENARTITHIPVENIEELKQPGLYIAVMKRPGRFSYDNEYTFFFVSDLGMHARVYQESMDVYVSSLASGKPKADVAVEVYDRKGKVVQKVFTNGKGRARLEQRPKSEHAIVARHKGHASLLSFREPALDLSEFDTKGIKQRPAELYLYSSRDLYRPGEKVDVSLLLRDSDGRAAQSFPLNMTLKRPDGRKVKQFVWTPEALGFFTHTIAIPSDGQTGEWSLEARANPRSREPLQTLRFHVEEFLPERMKLELESQQQRLKTREDFKVEVKGAYLYGAPASGNRFTAVMNVRRDLHPLEQFSAYVFGDVGEDGEKSRRELTDTKLDGNGNYRLKVKPFEQDYNSPMKVKITGSVYESGGRPVTRSIERTVWPAAELIGVRPLYAGEYAETNTSVGFEVIKTNAQGQLLAANNLEVKLIREDRDYYWTYDSQRGWHYEHSEAQYPVAVQSLDIIAKQRGKLALPVEYGSYRLEVFDPDTGLSNRFRFRAGWNWRAREQADSARPDKVNLTLDKPSYKGGDKVTLKIVAPHAGKGVLLLESDHLLMSKRLDIPEKGSEISFTLDKEWAQRHDLYVTALVYRAGDASDKITPNRAIGLLHIPMDRAQRKLDLQLGLPERQAPNSPLPIKIKLANHNKQSAMVTVAAVDVGILNITDFESPDAFKHFFAKRSYGIDSYDIYGKVIENLEGVRAKLRFGGDADVAGLKQSKRAQAEVKTVALFSGPVELDAKGEATVTLPVPDYNGSLRIMAVAFTEDRFGALDQEMIVAAPVVAEIATPRFLTAGDKSMLTLDLHNLSGQAQQLQIELKASAPLQLQRIKRSVPLANKAKTSLRFPLGAKEEFGVGEITLKVKGSKVNLQRRWELGVRPAYPGERLIDKDIIKPGDTLKLDTSALKGLMSKTVDASLVVSATPPLNIRSAVKGLLGYPYGCLEQTTSRAFPLIYVDEPKAKQVGLTPLSLAERSTRVDKAIERLRSMQLANGGFGLWNNKSPEEVWLTPYVIDFLQEARTQGFTVPDDMLQKGLKNLQRRLRGGGAVIPQRYYTQSREHLRFAANAYGGYVLAKVQRASLGTLRTLYDNHSKDAESGLSLVHLGLALHLQGDKKRGLKAIKEGLKKERVRQRYLGDYGSEARDSGLMLALLQRHDIKVDGQLDLLFRLGDAMKARRYLSTQERLAIFLAGYELSAYAVKPWKAQLKIGGDKSKLAEDGRYVRSFTLKELRQGIRLQSKADSPLYTAFEITGYSKQAPAEDVTKINVQRTLYDTQGKRLGKRPLRVGELLVAHLSIISDRHVENGLVVDLLPAGLEIENLNLTQGETLENLKIDGVDPMQAMNHTAIKHQEYRDDRFAAALALSPHRSSSLFYLVRVVSPGEYMVPPPFAEDMYDPEWRGIGTTPARLQVENKAP